MQNIALPKKIEFSPGSDPLEGIVTVEPLFPGYGMTLGNALRRVLLSSLPGAAVVGVKISGASHEFMALPKIKEDVLEIILNLKQLRFKIHTTEEVRLTLKAKGKKTVTAANIDKDSQVEIKNTDLVLAHLTDSTAQLEMEIVVSEGRGYRMVESSKKENKEVNYIEIDSIFSPVILVSIDVENTRVGKMTNWDKLVLKVKTDGTVSAQEAFQEAVQILVNQYNSLLPKAEEEVLETTEELTISDTQDGEQVEIVSDLDSVETVKVKKTKKESKSPKAKETKKSSKETKTSKTKKEKK